MPGLANQLFAGSAPFVPKALVRAIGGASGGGWERLAAALQASPPQAGGKAMTAIRANGVTIEYETFGPAGAPAILLVMGLGMQLVAWPDSLCEGLARRGFRVVRFDNRDVGLSSRMPVAGPARTTAHDGARRLRLPVRPPYTLNDMARDAVGLMDALGIDAAHVVGASMGGMIAQIVAAEHPDRVRSLTSIMSSPGARDADGRRCSRALLKPPPRDREQAIRRMTRLLPAGRRLGLSADRRGAQGEGRPLRASQLPPGQLRPPAHRHPDAGRAASPCCAACARRPWSCTARTTRWCRSSAER